MTQEECYFRAGNSAGKTAHIHNLLLPGIPIGPERVMARILLRIPKAPIGYLSAEATLAGLRTLGRKKPR